jgi:hypothetical protein
VKCGHGRLYAFSTVGSLIGAFLPVLVTIPYGGSRETFFLFGGILILMGLIGLGRIQFRVFLRKNLKKYDFMMVDVYSHSMTIPFHLATREFFELAKEGLADRGSLFMNVLAIKRDSRLAGVLRNTLASVFPYVYEVWNRSGNSLLFAFKERPDFEKIETRDRLFPLQRLVARMRIQAEPVFYNQNGEISRDNDALVEFLSAKLILEDKIWLTRKLLLKYDTAE